MIHGRRVRYAGPPLHRTVEECRDLRDRLHGATQEYKQRRVEAALGGAPANVAYAPIDFAKESLGETLRRAGFQAGRKTYFICEGVSTYIPEEGMKETLRAIAAESTPGSALLLEYLNRSGLELLRIYPSGTIASDWGEPLRVRRARWAGAGKLLPLEAEVWSWAKMLKIGSLESMRRVRHVPGRRATTEHIWGKRFDSGAKPPLRPWTMRVADKPRRPRLRRATGSPS